MLLPNWESKSTLGSPLNVQMNMMTQENLQGENEKQITSFTPTNNAFDDSSDISRKTFQPVQLFGKDGFRKINISPPKQQQKHESQKPVANIAVESFSQNNSWSAELLNKVLYGLLQQVELVKYLLGAKNENKHQKFMEAGQRMLDTIMKIVSSQMSKKPNNQRTLIHSLELNSVGEIFTMLNNLSLFYLKQNMNRQGFVLMQCAVQICKHYKEIMENSVLLSSLYNNLCFYHIKGNGMVSEQQAQKYVDGAITSQTKFSQDEDNSLALAISLNNRAVVELKKQNLLGSQEFSKKAIELIEPKVFGIINAGMFAFRSKEIHQHFTQALNVLLIAYYNFAASIDGKPESKNVYLKGMQLSYQYLGEGENSLMFKRFYHKYTRKYYALSAINNQKQVGRSTYMDISQQSKLPIPDLLPLECIKEDKSKDSMSHQNYIKFMTSFNQLDEQNNLISIQKNNFVKEDENNEFTLLDSNNSNRTRLTHLQNKNLDSGNSVMPKIQQQETNVSMKLPVTPQHTEIINIKPQRSEIVNSNHRVRSNENSLTHDNDDVISPPLMIHTTALDLKFIPRAQMPKQLELNQSDNSLMRDSTLEMNVSSPHNQQSKIVHQDPSLSQTAKFGKNYSEAKSGQASVKEDNTMQLRLEEERNKIKEMQEQMQSYQKQMMELQNQYREQLKLNQSNVQTMPLIPEVQTYETQEVPKLSKFQIFEELKEPQYKQVASNLIKKTYKQNQVIVEEGQIAASFYLIESGTVLVYKNTTTDPERKVRELHSGSHFGEVALLKNSTRTMSVKAVTECKIYELDKSIFSQIANQIDSKLKKDYNREFQQVLDNEAKIQQEKEALSNKQKELETKELQLKKQQEELVKLPQVVPLIKVDSLSPAGVIKKNETVNFDQESLHLKISKKIDESQLHDVWMTSGSRHFGKKSSGDQIFDIENSPSRLFRRQGSPAAMTQQIEIAQTLRQMSKTIISEEPDLNLGQNIVPQKKEVKSYAVTPKHQSTSNLQAIQPHLHFHFEKLNEQDENDLGFDDLIKQHQSLICPSDGMRNNTLINFEQLINTFDYLEDDQIRNQFYIDNLQNQQDTNFKWSPLQMKALIYLRESHKLFSPQNIWKFNAKLLEQIKREKKITCTRVIQQQIGQDIKLYNIKVVLTAIFGGSQDDTLEDTEDVGKYLESLATNTKLVLQAECDQNQLQKNQEGYTNQIEISFLELQTIMYMFSDVSSADSNPCVQNMLSSVPFYQLDDFQNFCNFLLFKYIEVFPGEDESFDVTRSSKMFTYSVDFKENPSGLFVMPHKITFLKVDESNENTEQISNNEAANQRQHSQSDNLQSAISIHSDRDLNFLNSFLNCQVDIFQMNTLSFKVVISPSYDLSMVLLTRTMLNQNHSAGEDFLSVQPESICQLSIDLQFDTQATVLKYFQTLQVNGMKFQNAQGLEKSQLARIQRPMEFYDKHLKKYVVELEKLIREEYKGLFSQDNRTPEEQQQEPDQVLPLNSHQRFFSLIIHKKIAYIQLKIDSASPSTMIVALANPQPTQNWVKDKNKNLKFICFYCDSDGLVQKCQLPHETSIRAISKTFGQEVDLGHFSVCKQYTLTQLCKMYVASMKLTVEVEESSDGSGIGSSDSFDFDSDSGSEEGASKKSAKVKAPVKAAIGKLIVAPLSALLLKREVKIFQDQVVVVTSEMLICAQAKKILGIKFSAYDQGTTHDSGVFLQVDQSQWPAVEGQKTERDKFHTQYSVMHLMQKVGLDYLFKHHLVLELHKSTLFKNKVIIKLVEPRMQTQKNLNDIVRELENISSMNAAQRERILNQMPSDHTTISQLERFVTSKVKSWISFTDQDQDTQTVRHKRLANETHQK